MEADKKNNLHRIDCVRTEDVIAHSIFTCRHAMAFVVQTINSAAHKYTAITVIIIMIPICRVKVHY